MQFAFSNFIVVVKPEEKAMTLCQCKGKNPIALQRYEKIMKMWVLLFRKGYLRASVSFRILQKLPQGLTCGNNSISDRKEA